MEHAIVFLDRESVGANVRKPDFPHTYTEYQSTWTPEDIVDRLKDATIALINKVPMRAEVLNKLGLTETIEFTGTEPFWGGEVTGDKPYEIPRRGLAILSKSGHVTNLEEPVLFNSLLERFFTELVNQLSNPWQIVAVIGAAIGAMSSGTAGRNLNILVIIVGTLRLMLGGGII